MVSIAFEQTTKINFKTSLINKLNLIIYLVCSTIFTKCFTSQLLKTYFVKKESLTAETFQDIIDNPDLYVAGRRGLRYIQSIKPEIFEKLFHRVIDYENSLNINSDKSLNDLLNSRLWEHISNGKAVAIVGSYEVQFFKNLYPDSKIMESEHKYNHFFSFTYVTKSVRNFTEIYRLYEKLKIL